ncbi:MAG TPA: DMT family transporter [Clostridia bacterium]|nr:DMT family transporter [Clostridia bacterium]HRX42154.1 DMT family transporter [Clostridia bacterium]
MDKNKGILFAALGALIWSTGGVFIKLVDAPGIYISAARSLVAGLIFLPFVKFNKIKWSWSILLLLLSFAYTMIGFVVATKLTTAANAIILQYTTPIWLFLYYSFRNRSFSKRKILPVALVSLGIVIFLFEPSQGTNMTGNLLALSTGISFAFVAHYSAKDHGIDGPGLISLCNLTTFLLALPFISNVTGITMSLDLLGIIGILFLGVFQIALGYVFYMKSLKLISPLDTSLICLIEPLTNPVWVLIFVKEVPSTFALTASVFVIAGILVNILQARSSRRVRIP